MEENFATRLKVFMDSVEMQSSQFADLCEIPRPSFSQLLSGRNQKVSDVLIRKIHTVFPDLSVTWLMFGEGPMLNPKNDSAAGSGGPVPSTDSHGTSAGSSSQNIDKNPSEFANYPYNGSANSEYSNLKPLTDPSTIPNSSIFQQLEESKKILELQTQIENLQKNPRRVVQITVYYDDSTFETFISSK